jgi:hypothetical protein
MSLAHLLATFALLADLKAGGKAAGLKQHSLCLLTQEARAAASLLQRVNLTQSARKGHKAVDRLATAPFEQGKGHVSYLYTFSAPGSLAFAHTDKSQSSECFPGIRFYREQTGYQDAFAEFTGFLHPKTNLIILGANQSASSYHPCLPDENFGQVSWPDRYTELPSIKVHSGVDIIERVREIY